MTSDHFNPAAELTEPSALILEIAGQEAKTPRLVPVFIRNLSAGGVTLTVSDPFALPDGDRYRHAACTLRLEEPGEAETLKIKATIAWTRFGQPGQPPLSLGLQLLKPPVEALRRLSNLLPHTSEDIKGLWERYDQVRESPDQVDLVHHCYIAGLVLLLGGLALQAAGSPTYKFCGWVLWLLGSLGIAGKIIRPFWPKQPSGDRIGNTL